MYPFSLLPRQENIHGLTLSIPLSNGHTESQLALQHLVMRRLHVVNQRPPRPWPLMPLWLTSMPLSEITVWPWIFLVPYLALPIRGVLKECTVETSGLALKVTKIKACIQWNLDIKRSDITKPSYNKVNLLVPALYIPLFFHPDIRRNLI